MRSHVCVNKKLQQQVCPSIKNPTLSLCTSEGIAREASTNVKGKLLQGKTFSHKKHAFLSIEVRGDLKEEFKAVHARLSIEVRGELVEGKGQGVGWREGGLGYCCE